MKNPSMSHKREIFHELSDSYSAKAMIYEQVKLNSRVLPDQKS